MKNLKAKLSVLALVLGIGSAFATMSNSVSTRKWTRTSSGYEQVTGEKGTDYFCIESANICTETYPEAVNPSTNPAPGQPGHVAPTSVELGDFQ